MGETRREPPETIRVKGTDGELLFDGLSVTIKHWWYADVGKSELSFPLSSIAGVEVKKGVMFASLTLIVPGGAQRAGDSGEGDPLKLGGLEKSEATLFRQLVLNAMRNDAVPLSAVPEVRTTAPGLADQLAQLAALREQGVLTDAEFTAVKARLIRGTSEPWDAVPPTA